MQLWTPEHAKTLIPALAVMIVIGIMLRLTIGKKDLKIRMIPFQILACLLFIIEIGKQIYSFRHSYDLYHIPLHFCSLFIFALPIMAFYRGKHQTTVFEVVTVLCTSMTVLMLIYPDLIYGAGNIRDYFKGYLDFHTVTFHNTVMFELVLILSLDLVDGKRMPMFKPLTAVTLIFCGISAIMAQLLETNYANFYRCNIPPLEAIRVAVEGALGYVFAQILYVLIVSALTWGFVLLSCAIYRLLRRLLSAKEPLTV